MPWPGWGRLKKYAKPSLSLTFAGMFNTITLPIIVITAIFSILAFNRPDIMAQYQFNAYMIAHRKQWYRFFTHAFLHADWVHLIVNMFVLYSFGGFVEYMFDGYFHEKGPFVYLGLYVGAIFASSIVSYRKHRNNHWYNAIGASGAVSAVLFSAVVFAPFQKIYLYAVLPMPALLWAVLYMVYSAYMGRRGGDNIGHDAHLWGGVFGLFYTMLVDPDIGRAFFMQMASFFT